MTRSVRLLHLHSDGRPVHPGLLAVELGVRLCVIVRPSPHIDVSSLRLWTNCPPGIPVLAYADGATAATGIGQGQEGTHTKARHKHVPAFRRHTFWCIEGTDEGEMNVDGDWQAYIDIEQPGAFEFFLEFTKQSNDGTLIDASPWASAAGQALADSGGAPLALGAVSMPAPDMSRRGPVIRIVVQPELTVRLWQNVPSAPETSQSARAGSGHVGARSDRMTLLQDAPFPILRAGSDGPAARPSTGSGSVDDEGIEEEDGDVIQAGDLDSSDDDTESSDEEGMGGYARGSQGLSAAAGSRANDPGPQPVLLPGTHLPVPVGCTRSMLELPLPLDGICLQTQLTRNLGPIDQWLYYADLHSVAKAASAPSVPVVPVQGGDLPPGWDTPVALGTLAEPLACKYNFLHLTPVQKLGGSNSCYSLQDQLCLDWRTYEGNVGVQAAAAAAIQAMPWVQQTMQDVQAGKAVDAAARTRAEIAVWSHPYVESAKSACLSEVLTALESYHGVLAMVDIVLNHTSTDSPWLTSHPEAGYSLANSPHLRSAWELDETMLRVSSAVLEGRLPGLSAAMSHEGAVDGVLDAIAHHPQLGIPAARLWEYYVLDVYGTLAAAASLVPGIEIAGENLEKMRQEDNTAGALPALSPLPVTTAGVAPALLSWQRRAEIACCRHDAIAALMLAFKSAGLDHGSPAPHSVPVSDHALEGLVDLLCTQAAKQDGPGSGRIPQSPAASATPGGSTPVATPAADEVVSPGPSIQGGAGAGAQVGANRPSWMSRGIYSPPVSPPAVTYAQQGQICSPHPANRTPSAMSVQYVPTESTVQGKEASILHDGVWNDGTGGRFSLHLDIGKAIAALNTLPGVQINPDAWCLPSHGGSDGDARKGLPLLASLQLIKRLCDMINLRMFKRYDGDMSSALQAMRGTAKYQWLQQWGCKEKLEKDRPIVWSYFIRLPAANEPSTTHVLACNGFIWNGDPEIDFTLPVDSARGYAHLVRASMAQGEFVKARKHMPRGDLPEQIEAGRSSAGSDGAASGPIPLPSYPGRDLLCYSDIQWDHVLSCMAAGDAQGLDRVYSIHTSVTTPVPSPIHGRSAGSTSRPSRHLQIQVDVDAVSSDACLHLDPSKLNLPLCTASTPYMRRDIVIWGDCVKLRYGLNASESPWLWSHMRLYVQRMAKLFHGVRLDNAHGTPLHVAAHMIDCARAVRPSLYVNAELFTGSLDRDVEYCSRLGINSLVREAMQAHSPGDMAGQVYSYGGTAVASVRPPLRGGSAAARIEALLASRTSTHGASGEAYTQNGGDSGNGGGTTLLLQEGNDPAREAMVALRNLLPSTMSSKDMGMGLGLSGSERCASKPTGYLAHVNGFFVAGTWQDSNDTGHSSGHGHYGMHRGAYGGSNASLSFMDQAFASPGGAHLPPRALLSAGGDGSSMGSSGLHLGTPRGARPSSAHQPGAVLTLPAHLVLQHAGTAAVSTLLPCPLPALYFDCTHDNPTPNEKRHPVDAASSMAVAAAAVCPVGSVRGYDQCVPENISVVTDCRQYGDTPSQLRGLVHKWASDVACSSLGESSLEGGQAAELDKPSGHLGLLYGCDMLSGLRRLRRRVNALKQELSVRGVTEIYVKTYEAAHGAEIVSVLRAHPVLPHGYIVISRSAFSRYAGDARWDSGSLPEVRVEGTVTAVVMACTAYCPGKEVKGKPPVGPLSQAPHVLHASHPVQQALRGDLQEPDTLDAMFADIPSSAGRGWSSRDGVYSAHTDPLTAALDDPQWTPCATHVNGLPVRLDYRDDSWSKSGSVREDSLGLVQGVSEVQAGGSNSGDGSVKGYIESIIRLDPGRFTPGSVLILRVRSPRNVALRMGRQSSTAHHPASVPSLATQWGTAGGSSAGHPSLLITLGRSPSRVSMRLHGAGLELSPSRPGPGSPLVTIPTSTPASVPRALGPGAPPAGAVQNGKLNTLYGPSVAELRACLVNNPAVTLVHLNHLLYRCEPEERDVSGGSRGVYHVPDHGPLAWAGMAGAAHALRHCVRWNDMGHPLFANLRAGPWLLQYYCTRLAGWSALAGVQAWLAGHMSIIAGMPAGLRPQGFDRVATAVYHAGIEAALQRMGGPLLPRGYTHSQHYVVSVSSALGHTGGVAEGVYYRGTGEDQPLGSVEVDTPSASDARGELQLLSGSALGGTPDSVADAEPMIEAQADPAAPPPFLTALALTSVMLVGQVPSAPLLGVPLLEPPAGSQGHGLMKAEAGLAAGLDHFATGYMRAWGRDTFISLRGLLLVTGRYSEARSHILSFASVLRHGMIPNLMDGGFNPRYNCRDAVWWLLQAIQDYCSMVPNGTSLLHETVHRRWPSDEQSQYREVPGSGLEFIGGAEEYPLEQPLWQVIVEALGKHVAGISYREWNAGTRIDAHMREEGFHVRAWVDKDSGLVYGGNAWNCGTWMDKMGSCPGVNQGQPATPRDGAAVEIQGLCYSTVKWLAGLVDAGVLPTEGVSLPEAQGVLTWAQWRDKLKSSFKRAFYIPLDPGQDDPSTIHSPFVHHRGMYKDTHGSSAGWQDYQLRPNFLISMAVAPDLFTPAHAQAALAVAERQLLGPHQLGVKTLDPADWAYRPHYDNSAGPEAGKETAHGWNYHQGPEWLWPYGYYLRARLHFPPLPMQSKLSDGQASGAWRDKDTARRWLAARLALQRQHMETHPSGGLPELTNANGEHCKDSCVVQAWSSSTLLDALYDLAALVSNKGL